VLEVVWLLHLSIKHLASAQHSSSDIAKYCPVLCYISFDMVPPGHTIYCLSLNSCVMICWSTMPDL